MFVFQNDDVTGGKSADVKTRRISPLDVEKVQSSLKAIVRDWSDEGADERKTSYGPILDRLETIFKGKNKEDVKVSVLGQCYYERNFKG